MATDSTDSDSALKREHLQPTDLLNFSEASIQQLVAVRKWAELPIGERIGAVYDFVRNEIAFGYNVDDNVTASRVLADGYGQCNTKATLLMALLRATNVPCRFHAATIRKQLQRGVISGVFYWMAPQRILHSWVEVLSGGEWKRLEGVILDERYLSGLRSHISQGSGALLGYAVGTNDLGQLQVEWTGCDTEIQMTGVDSDLGIHPDPDSFFAAAGTNLTGLSASIYRHLVRHVMNRKVAAIRSCP